MKEQIKNKVVKLAFDKLEERENMEGPDLLAKVNDFMLNLFGEDWGESFELKEDMKLAILSGDSLFFKIVGYERFFFRVWFNRRDNTIINDFLLSTEGGACLFRDPSRHPRSEIKNLEEFGERFKDFLRWSEEREKIEKGRTQKK